MAGTIPQELKQSGNTKPLVLSGSLRMLKTSKIGDKLVAKTWDSSTSVLLQRIPRDFP